MKPSVSLFGLVLSGVLLMSGGARAESVDEFGKRLGKAMATGDIAGASAMIDQAAFLDVITRNLAAPPAAKAGFIEGLGDVGMQFYSKINEQLASTGSYTYLHTVKREDGERALFRLLNADGGVNYHEYITTEGAGGKRKTTDIFVHATGETLGQTVRRMYMQVALGKDNASVREWSTQFQKIQDARNANDHKAVVAVYDALPEKLKKEKIFSSVRVMSAMQLSHDVYLPILKDHMARFGKDTAVLLLAIDLHVLNKDFEKANEAVGEIDKNIGGDPYLDVMRANIHAAAGDMPKCIELSKKALSRDPTLITAADIILTQALEKKDFKTACDMMLHMEQKTTFRFGDYASIDLFKEFAASPEKARFDKERPKK